MIYFLTGENWYARDRVLKHLFKELADETPERPDTSRLTAAELDDLLRAQSLFSEKRCVILTNLSENKHAWDALGELVDQVSPDVSLIVVEDKPDKRTKTYKALQKSATTKEFPLWTPRDTAKATEWLLTEAKSQDLPLKTRDAKQLVERVGVDQVRLAGALEKLALVDGITPEAIASSIDSHPEENVFQLLETALKGDIKELQAAVTTLRQTEEPYRVFGLLSSQLLQLAALTYRKDMSPGDVAKKIGAQPFVLTNLRPYARNISEHDMANIVQLAADTDMKMKSVSVDPWLLIEELLIKLAYER